MLVLLGAPAVASAQEVVVELRVGEQRKGVASDRPICDNPSVAVISGGVLRAVGPGETLCSATPVQNQGIRVVYRVVVTRPDPPKKPDR